MTELSKVLPESVLADLRSRHGEAQRAYHGWSHIEALLAMHRELDGQWHDPQAALLAVLFHDAVYDPRATDNEVQSAALLRQALAGLVPPARLDLAEALVLATRAHAIPMDLPMGEAADMALFLDMDLAILGSDPALFDSYEAGVRREYAHVPDDQFRLGRRQVLERFSKRELLYLSPWGQCRFEAQARANIARSLAALGAG